MWFQTWMQTPYEYTTRKNKEYWTWTFMHTHSKAHLMCSKHNLRLWEYFYFNSLWLFDHHHHHHASKSNHFIAKMRLNRLYSNKILPWLILYTYIIYGIECRLFFWFFCTIPFRFHHKEIQVIRLYFYAWPLPYDFAIFWVCIFRSFFSRIQQFGPFRSPYSFRANDILCGHLKDQISPFDVTSCWYIIDEEFSAPYVLTSIDFILSVFL